MSAEITNSAQPSAPDSHNERFGYAGDVTPSEALKLLKDKADAVLVDVRTPQEWEQVGLPDLSAIGKAPLRLSWKLLPSGETNPQFVPEFSRLPVASETPVLLLCRSGGRSQAAACALTNAGFTRCYNIAGGFEGPQGWKATQLPWKQ